MLNLSSLDSLVSARRARARAARVAAAAAINGANAADHTSMALALAIASCWHDQAEADSLETIVCLGDICVGSVVF